MPSLSTLARLVLLAVILGTGIAVSKQEPVVSDEPLYRAVNSRDGLVIHGYDTVAYLDDYEAVPGSPEFSAEWRGGEWRFASPRNRARFLANPLAYAPQYGGFGAYGAAIGKAHDIDPTVFDVVDGKLYLHSNDRVQELWNRNPQGYIAEADEAWHHRARAVNP
ncbi:YHS domain protein [alpha proteobacterium BAL199]|jgi:YHS domain-containing protein|nr:YHS domain protein [alpha proteobacterium BAL199]